MSAAVEAAPGATERIKALNDQYIINTYGARKIALVRGEGTHLWGVDGREYLDLFAGIAVCNLGHCHPAVTEAIREQAGKLLHVSNLYYIEPQVELAELLAQVCFADRWFFCNSGAEANEAALKLARRYWDQKGTPKPLVVAAEQSFHGRTFGALTATGQPKYHQGFAPLLPGISHIPYNDIAALEAALTPEVGAVLLEPLQGEGGVRVPETAYWRQVRDLCDRRGVLLILNEVQTGLGRTGPLFAHQGYGITPDIMTLAKGLANGVPMGALGCTEEVASGFAPGTHASTFGGNPLSSAAALATLKALTAPGFLEHAAAMGEYFRERLRGLASRFECIVEVRGRGLMIGIEFREPVAPLIERMIAAGIICGPAGPNVLRFLPPLIVEEHEVDQGVAVLEQCLGDLEW
ncbi:MAG: acetylornithine transaminase [Candidatus Hydrogenedentes bacterium]|nr:acetylornithine transaminase [Candidatus Hydrogenedentota bacterium]